jgi:uncharacterized protein (TIGR03437 family)
VSSGFVSEVSADGSTLLFSSNADPIGSLALDASGNAFLGGRATVPGSGNDYPFVPSYTVDLLRIDGAVSGAVTVEAPQGITIASASDYDTGVAPGKIVVLTGSGLGPAQAVGPQVTAGQVATSLAGTTVAFDGVPAPLLSVQAGQIVCVVPFAVGSQSYDTTLQVSSGGALSNAILLPAFSTTTEILSVVNQDGSLNSANHPASAGSIVTIYAAGFGQTDPPSVDGRINGSDMRLPTYADIDVQISDGDVEILYAGPAPGQVAGIFQINFRVPQLDPGSYATWIGLGEIESDYGSSTLSGDVVTLNLVVGP